MRRALVLSGAAILLTAACSNRANDLDTYYDDPTSAAPETTSAPAATTTSAAPTTTSAPAPAVDLARVAMSPADLVAEQVEASTTATSAPLTALPDCAAVLPVPEAGRQSTWKYATGSLLRQYVAHYPRGAAAPVDVLSTCAETDPQPSGTAATMWCVTAQAKSTCTVAMAKGAVFTAVTVEAGTAARARAAIERLTPVAAAALARQGG